MGLKDIERWVEERSGGTPHGHAVVCRGRKLLERYGGGASRRCLWDVGSIRKSFTSALSGCLVEEGVVSLETPACEKWPELTRLSGREKDRYITLHHLLGTTSGWLTDEAPGERFRYNNAAFSAAEQVIACSTDRPVPAEVTTRFARPLGMESFRAYHRDAPFNASDFGDPGPKMVVECNLRDLIRWGRLWLQGGNWEGRQLIPREYVDRATRRVDPELTDSHYGYCWFVNAQRELWPAAPRDAFGHPGVGFYLGGGEPVPSRCFLWVCPSRSTVAAICADPCTGIAEDHRNVPMATTDAWIGRVLEVIE